MPDAPPEVRALYRRHARGNSLFRNLGDGRFEDVTLEARADDGPLGVVVRRARLRQRRLGGPLRRQRHADARRTSRATWTGSSGARSWPARRSRACTGTPYDDAWRAINQLLIHGSIASRQRNVLLRNDGQGGFDDVSGTVGPRPRSGRPLVRGARPRRDGDPDLAVMAARQAPQLRVFRNDFAARRASLARAPDAAPTSNRDAIGARVTRRDRPAAADARSCRPARASCRSTRRSCSSGSARASASLKLTVDWPSGADAGLHRRAARHAALRLVEGGDARDGAASRRAGDGAVDAAPAAAPAVAARAPPGSTSRSRRPTSRCPTSPARRARSRRCRASPAVAPALVGGVRRRRAPRSRRSARGRGALDAAGVGVDRHRARRARGLPQVRARGRASPAVPVVARDAASSALSYAILNRHLFMNRQDLRLPTAFLLDGGGRVVKVYRDRVDVARDRCATRRRSRRPRPSGSRAPCRFPGRSTRRCRCATTCPTAASCSTRASRRPRSSPSSARRRRTRAPRRSIAWARCSRRAARRPGRARRFERALALQPDLAEASNDLGALLAQGGDLDGGDRALPGGARGRRPTTPTRSTTSATRCCSSGRDERGARALREGARAAARLPRGAQQPGPAPRPRAATWTGAERYFRRRSRGAPTTARPRTTSRSCWSRAAMPTRRCRLLEGFLARDPAFENAYVTLAKIHLSRGDGTKVAVLERLLQRNPDPPGSRILDIAALNIDPA